MLNVSDSSVDNAADFQTEIDGVFGRIAARYNLLCDLFSFGTHRLWKRRIAALIAGEPWTNLLDGAAGTGDVVIRIAKRKHSTTRQTVVVSDISPNMLAIARARASGLGQAIEFRVLDAQDMPSIADESFDQYCISLALKICKRQPVLREALRILRPGGRLVTLETSHIPWAWAERAYLAYLTIYVPLIGWLAAAGDAPAYRYIVKTIREFPTAEAFAIELSDIGFEAVTFERLSFGIAAIHVAVKPRGRPASIA